MALRLSGNRPPKGRDAASLRKWGIIFLTLGTVGRCVLQRQLLGIGSITSDELLTAMQNNSAVMGIATAALICQILETCAAPMFSFLLVEGFLRTSSFEKYLIRVGALALISEIPYNFAYSGGLIDLGTRNPVFALLICLVMLHFFAKYQEKSAKNIAMKALIAVAAFLWCVMLRIDHGMCLVIMVGFLWMVRDKSNVRALFGFCSAMACTLFDMYYIGSCMSFILLHRYSEERGEQNQVINYAFYPLMLLIVGVVAMSIG